MSASDFAAAIDFGLQPVGIVQGFSVAVVSAVGPNASMRHSRWVGLDPGTEVLSRYPCPHGSSSKIPHRSEGRNFEQPWVAEAWSGAFAAAYGALVEQAKGLAAHGVVGVVLDNPSPFASGLLEFRIRGTAVRAEGVDPEAPLWVTELNGYRLVKMVEAGFWPSNLVASVASVRMRAVCETKMLMAGKFDDLANPIRFVKPGAAIRQYSDAQMQVRRLARRRAVDAAGDDLLHGQSRVHKRAVGDGDLELACVVTGSLLRRQGGSSAETPTPAMILS